MLLLRHPEFRSLRRVRWITSSLVPLSGRPGTSHARCHRTQGVTAFKSSSTRGNRALSAMGAAFRGRLERACPARRSSATGGLGPSCRSGSQRRARDLPTASRRCQALGPRHGIHRAGTSADDRDGIAGRLINWHVGRSEPIRQDQFANSLREDQQVSMDEKKCCWSDEAIKSAMPCRYCVLLEARALEYQFVPNVERRVVTRRIASRVGLLPSGEHRSRHALTRTQRQQRALRVQRNAVCVQRFLDRVRSASLERSGGSTSGSAAKRRSASQVMLRRGRVRALAR